MKLRNKIGALTVGLALAAVPATAVAIPTYGPDYNTPPANPTPPQQAKAYGLRCQGKSKKHVKGEKGTEFSRCVRGLKVQDFGPKCQGMSKKHVKGEKGTEFSRCVNTLARVANNEDLSPAKACKDRSRKHVKGEKGTEFSRCVKAAAQVRKEETEEPTTV